MRRTFIRNKRATNLYRSIIEKNRKKLTLLCIEMEDSDVSESSNSLNDSLNTSDITLEYLNDVETERRIVPIVYLTILCILGTIGNLLIMYVYLIKFRRKATHRTFIVALAIADFLVCSFAIPFEIFQMTREYTFNAEWLCKFFRMFKNSFTLSSALILIGLSVNRYRSICYPLKTQLTYCQALKCIVCLVCFASVFASPEIFLTGIKIHKLENNLVGKDCSDSSEYEHTMYPMIYGTTQMVLYILCTISLLVMCLLIGRQIMRHVTFRDQFRLSKIFKTTSKETSVSTSTMVGIEKGSSTKKRVKDRLFSHKKHKTSSHKRINSPTKVTRTALVVSICFVILYLPYITMKILSAVTEGHIMPPSKLASIIMPTLSRTHFMNNVVNFIIYLKMDLSFRRQCKELLVTFISIFVKKVIIS
ncbi:thyrotropin-releasing hormone receptor-like [Mytilus edulis]|uniref:thyrotropin-releasing hormone receptor-like n=1 Tax=Mytilus edulis TaxID=6550 RepID=UPI0039EF0AC9